MKSLASIALAAAAAVSAGPASATWVGLADGQYQVTLQCTNSVTLDCSQSFVGTVTVQGSGLSQLDISLGGLDFSGDPAENVVDAATGSSEGSFSQDPVGAAMSLRLVTDGTFLGFTQGQRFWTYCSDLPNTQSCLADTEGLWSARRIGSVDEPQTLAAVALALAAALGVTRRRRRAAA